MSTRIIAGLIVLTAGLALADTPGDKASPEAWLAETRATFEQACRSEACRLELLAVQQQYDSDCFLRVLGLAVNDSACRTAAASSACAADPSWEAIRVARWAPDQRVRFAADHWLGRAAVERWSSPLLADLLERPPTPSADTVQVDTWVRAVLAATTDASPLQRATIAELVTLRPQLDPHRLLAARSGDATAELALIKTSEAFHLGQTRFDRAIDLALLGTPEALRAVARDVRSSLAWQPTREGELVGATMRDQALIALRSAFPDEPLFREELAAAEKAEWGDIREAARIQEAYFDRVEAFLVERTGVRWDRPRPDVGLLGKRTPDEWRAAGTSGVKGGAR